MKKLLLATTACVGFAAAAHAADLPMRAAPPPVYAAPAFTWTGFYIGVNAGYAFDTRNRDDQNNFGGNSLFVPGPFGSAANVGYFVASPGGVVFPAQLAPFAGYTTATGANIPLPGNGFNNSDNNRNRGGFTGGGQIGYNWQLTPGAGFVIGIEADAQYADLNRNNNNDGFFGTSGFGAPIPFLGTVPGATPATTFAVPLTAFTGPVPSTLSLTNPSGNGFGNRQGIDWFGTVRGRLGYAFDRTLIYVTGGLAYGGGSQDNNNNYNNANYYYNNNFNSDDNNRIRIGYAVGGGLEYAFTNNLTAKIEGLYVSLQERNNNNGFYNNPVRYAQDNAGNNYYAPASAVSNNNSFFGNRRREGEFAVVRVGLNYKFGGWDAGPSAPVVARY